MNRKKKIKIVIYSLLFGLILGGAGFITYNYFYPNGGIFSFLPSKETTTNTVANPLDGTQSDPSLANRHPLAIIVENYPAARPQIGLRDASIVYEAISEGGITRFMAVYGPKDVSKVGPVRSMRTFFLDWATEYNAFTAHVGGNIDALDRIKPEKVPDLDQFGLGTKAYWREPVKGVATEHTMFTDTTKLYAAAKEKGYDLAANFKAMKFLTTKNFKAPAITSQTFIIDFSSASYKVDYAYDPKTMTYLRNIAGSAHKDRNTGNQLAPTNVIIQAVSRHEGTTRINENSWTMNTIGEGDAIVLYGGKEIKATWKKKDLHSRTLFYDTTAKEISFLPGQFWYEIVPPEVFAKVKVTTVSASPSVSPSATADEL